MDYGKPFSSGDVITVTLDLDANTLSFAVNGDDQGVAYTAASGIGQYTLVPAVCLGSTDGQKLARVSIVGPSAAPRRFDRFACSPKVREGVRSGVWVARLRGSDGDGWCGTSGAPPSGTCL